MKRSRLFGICQIALNYIDSQDTTTALVLYPTNSFVHIFLVFEILTRSLPEVTPLALYFRLTASDTEVHILRSMYVPLVPSCRLTLSGESTGLVIRISLVCATLRDVRLALDVRQERFSEVFEESSALLPGT